MEILVTVILTAVLVSALTYSLLSLRWKKTQADEPPLITTSVAMGPSGIVTSFPATDHYECNQWIEFLTGATKVLEVPCDINKIDESVILELYEVTQANVSAKISEICSGTGCVQVKHGPDTHIVDCYISGNGDTVAQLVRQVWFKCIALL